MKFPPGTMTGFGMARVKQEGAPVHPAEYFWECFCHVCEWRWERQLREWADWNAFRPPDLARDA